MNNKGAIKMNMLEVKKLIGNTPMVRIDCVHNCIKKSVFVKLEWYSITGSIKDRAAFYIINEAKKTGELKESQPIVEATSGNMGISIAAIGGLLGHEVHIFMPNWMSNERKQILRGYGAILHEVSREEGGFVGAIRLAKELAKEIGGFCTCQFENENNTKAHYETTALEIINNMKDIKIDGFVSGIGTGGTLMGISSRLKEFDSTINAYAFEPDTLSVILNGATSGEHKIAGVGDEFIPELVDKEKIDEILLINDDDSINMSRIIARDLGLGVGISSGANFLTSILVNDGTKNIVTVFPDDNKKYLSTDLGKEINLDKKLLSNGIKCIGYEVI